MSFGFQSINDNAFVQIDSEAPRLCMLTRGSCSGVATATATFPRAVTSQNPPLVFIRPHQTGLIQVPYSVWFTGGPATGQVFQ